MINENKEEYNLVDGAMPNGKATGGYWKGSLGAMGTYYIASLAEMGLVAPLTDNMHLYNITKKTDANYITGEHLADAFEKSVGKESSLLFLKCLSEGIVNNNELDILVKTFKAKSMNIGDETNLLIAMLLQHDNPAAETKTYMRRNTIQLLLNYFITNEVDYLSELKFARYVYNEFKRGNTKSVSAIGWYAYYLNDSRQYESLIIFSELLKRLNNSNMPGGWELIENITSDLADEVCIDFAIESETLEEVIDNWDMYKRPLNIMSEAFYVILDDYVQNKSYDDYKSELRLFFHGIHNDAMSPSTAKYAWRHGIKRKPNMVSTPISTTAFLVLTIGLTNHPSSMKRKWMLFALPAASISSSPTPLPLVVNYKPKADLPDGQ